jgi:hypothetical protein
VFGAVRESVRAALPPTTSNLTPALLPTAAAVTNCHTTTHTAAIEVLEEEPVEELPTVQPIVEATNETDATAAPAPAKSSAVGTGYSFAATVFALAVGAVLAL